MMEHATLFIERCLVRNKVIKSRKGTRNRDRVATRSKTREFRRRKMRAHIRDLELQLKEAV
jgi:hypothetical protein